jgi:hypothetical protein
MINWSRGVVARYYATIVDPKTWKNVSEVNIIGGSIKYSSSGERASADIDCRSFDHDNEYWVRIYLEARQGSDAELIPLFTGVASVPDISYHGRTESSKLQCYSALSIADKIYLPLGWYVRKDSNGANIIRDLLKDSVPSPIVIDDIPNDEPQPIIDQNIIAENSETVLSMVDRILNIIKWRLILDGDGTIHIAPYSDSIIATFDYRENDIFEMDVSISNNWYDVPNVYRAVGSGISSIARDEDPNSRFSIPNRGREIWVSEDNCVLASGEKIGDYAIRKLKEAQNIYKTLDYNRRFDPNVRVTDIVRINYLEQNISGLFMVKSQSLSIGYGGTVSEQAEG